MGQITEAFARTMLACCERGEHPPLTVWETRQLLHAWLTLHASDGVSLCAGSHESLPADDPMRRLVVDGVPIAISLGKEKPQ